MHQCVRHLVKSQQKCFSGMQQCCKKRGKFIFSFIVVCKALKNQFSEKRFDRTCLKGMLKASFNQTIMKKLQSLFFFLSNPVPLM